MIKYNYSNLYLREDPSNKDVYFVGISEMFVESNSVIENVTVNESTELTHGEDFITIDNDNETIDFFSPFKMEVVEINTEVDLEQSILNDPEYDGWIVKVRCSKSNYESLFNYEEYAKSFEEGVLEYE